MTRSDLIAALASRFPNLMSKDAEVSVKEILDAISNALAKGDRVEIRGFGSFGLNYRPARTGRNPKTLAANCRSGGGAARDPCRLRRHDRQRFGRFWRFC